MYVHILIPDKVEVGPGMACRGLRLAVLNGLIDCRGAGDHTFTRAWDFTLALKR